METGFKLDFRQRKVELIFKEESVFEIKYDTVGTCPIHSEAYRGSQIRFHSTNPSHGVQNVGTSYSKIAIQ